MSFPSPLFIGIDPSGGRQPFIYAVLDEDARLRSLAEGELDEVLALLSEQEAVTVAVCSPLRPNRGLARKLMEKHGQAAIRLRGSGMRMAEYELGQHGIGVSHTPGGEELCPAWVQLGFELYRKLAGMGFKPYPSKTFPRQFLETHPQAAFCALLGHSPLPRPTLEGRLQRQVILYENGMGIKDPMDFFEEITRHRLLQGVLPVELIYTSEQLDAMAAAFTAYLAATRTQEVSFIGSASEGRIVLPVRELKERY